MEVFSSYISDASKRFEQHANHIVYALLASAWAIIFSAKDKSLKIMLGVVVGTTVLYLFFSLIYLCFIERKARKTHILLSENGITVEDAAKEWNSFSDLTSSFMLIKLVAIVMMVLLFAVGYFFYVQSIK